MCGICGIASARGPVDPGRLAEMSATLVHRGPDSDGSFVDGGVGLAARRLSIIDLEHGDQPIANIPRSRRAKSSPCSSYRCTSTSVSQRVRKR